MLAYVFFVLYVNFLDFDCTNRKALIIYLRVKYDNDDGDKSSFDKNF